ncbi:laminin subunit alpha-3 isoform X3 [Protopterus annectens]|uniref:laminin subunit alpha-3 isoform X3 n=1 Tax=Protopterus annectens TaxID=7888 RepID=UPI001CF9EB84|nr:laminin subunit alpha-3 isoform X3 [Protopterus annectens]
MARWQEIEALALIFLLGFFLHSSGAQVAPERGTGYSLHPPYFNLAERAQIRATATCGEDETGRPWPELYCKLVGGPAAGFASYTIQGQFCDHCNSSIPSKSHPISYAIDGTERWWQSPPLSRGLQYNEVNVTLDLGQLFHVAYVLIKFANSPRPDLWALERSVDFGRTYEPWQYFANLKRDCLEVFRKRPEARIIRDDDVICTTEYSRIVPLENGEIVVSLVNRRPGAKNFTYSPILREFTKATNIRLRFLRTNTLLGHLISKAQRDTTVTRRYYYSIKDISVGGRCVCHGHAEVCDSMDPANPYRLHCNCQHNTCGEFCERCCPGYNQKPWRPATINSANECERCNCHGHSSECYYDAGVEQQKESLNIYGEYKGGGVCVNCQHNTAGINCEKCALGYYRPYGIPVEAVDGCIPCRCNPDYTNGCEAGSGRCVCKPNFRGENCHMCAYGYYGFPQCIRIPIYSSPRPPTVRPSSEPTRACDCSNQGVERPGCDAVTGQCYCRTGFHGISCDHCAIGYFNFPFCQECSCNTAGTTLQVCNPTGRCLCRPEVTGIRCDQCRPGYYSFPICQACSCDSYGSADMTCDPNGQCHCRPGFGGLTCNQCAPGNYGYPACLSCQCSADGSISSVCHSSTGQCHCRPGITGQNCDRCRSEFQDFPHCQDIPDDCNPAGTESIGSDSDSESHCYCLPAVEGPTCNTCKPLYWNLAAENEEGCIECLCDVRGTLSGVGECQEDGQCFCKPNVCGGPCNSCDDGYFALENRNYFGCQGCQCDVGGSTALRCDKHSGTCLCRDHVEGQICNQPVRGYYFPDLHHMRFEIEDGTTPDGRGVRFGYDPQAFPDFSWRGYAQMSPVQNEVRVTLHVEKFTLSLFRVALRYVNPGPDTISSRMTAYQSRSNTATLQTKYISFPPSKKPAFVTVPGGGFADPFALTPGKWIVSIVAEGVLLDYLVLLPSDYYEAAILQMKVTEPCTYANHPQHSSEPCLVYDYLPLEQYANAHGLTGVLSAYGRHQHVSARQPTPEHIPLADISGRQVQLQIRLHVTHPGLYVVVLEYLNEDEAVLHTDIIMKNSQGPIKQAVVNIYSCKYSFLCRSVAVGDKGQVAVFQLPMDVELELSARHSDLLLHKVFLIPLEEFSMEHIQPKVHCIATHGRFFKNSTSCLPSKFETPPTTLLLNALQDGHLLIEPEQVQTSVFDQQTPFISSTSRLNGILLKPTQSQITFNARVPSTGRYIFLVHFYQPEHPAFPVEVLVDGGRLWQGTFKAYFCPHNYGCRDHVVADSRIGLDMTDPGLSITVKVPSGKTLVLDQILIIPADSYSPGLLNEAPLDRSFEFINNCGGNSFFIDPVTATRFCKESARSLVAFYNGGALPCNCHVEGSTSRICNPMGGQCSCKTFVIGRQCSRCATGYYGFPNCRPCNCGNRLCDEITGQCICPPHTVKPQCEICIKETFSYHPLIGCEGCNCSTSGISNAADPDCDKRSGQCLCKPGIAGRQCNRCAPGFYHFPSCLRCDCNRGGTQSDICDPENGKCLCKENVEGPRCDVCRPGSFYLDPENPKGCTSCFCFRRTNQCHSTDKYRTKFVDMKNWKLEATDQTYVPVAFNPHSNTAVADVQELPASVLDLLWVAPPSYLGNKLSSYGGYLRYHIKSFGLPAEMILLEKRSDVQLTGMQMSIVYVDQNNPSPDRIYVGQVKLLEDNFKHASTNSPVSRDELMLVLSKLDGLYIRALYFTETQRLTLGDVSLDVTSFQGSGNTAGNVEVCSCPSKYVGDSCEECAPGQYREKGWFLTHCVPCMCNGHSTRCQDETGICINCKDNTAGDHCERCEEGYFGNATHGSCDLCPCPLLVPSNSFATGCTSIGGIVQCTCKPGYTGTQCERCAPGYFGNPMKRGSICRPCNCDISKTCDHVTGECMDLEPKDTDTDNCDACDSCVTTLLSDLNNMETELLNIKIRIQNASASSMSRERMKKIEALTRNAKILVDRYRLTVNSQKMTISELETDTLNLNQDINILENKVNFNSREAQRLLNEIDKTKEQSEDLFRRLQIIIRIIQDLLKRLESLDAGGSVIPSGEYAKKLTDAERMMTEMRNRNFGTQKANAADEKTEAQNLLAYVKSELHRRQAENQQLAKRITDSLTNYESKLVDLQEALEDATHLIKHANDLNKDNSKSLQDIKNRIRDVGKQHSSISDSLTEARSSLKQTSDLLKMLDASREEYAKLAAQLDGARLELSDKVRRLSQAAEKEPLVRRAEDHALALQSLADQMAEMKKNASDDELVRKANDAARAYREIIDAVKAAEDAANTAKNAASKAFETVEKEGLPENARRSKADSSILLTEANAVQGQLQGQAENLQDAKTRLAGANQKKDSLENDLKRAQAKLNSIRRDDIADKITAANRTVGSANDVTDGVMNKLQPIKDELNEIKLRVGSGSTAEYNKLISEADSSVKKLTSTIPDLLRKLNSTQQQLMPLSNISENVNRIRELIQQARDAADKVTVPMKFNGRSGVEVRPPSDLDDLKAYTSLSLYVHQPMSRGDDNPSHFVMYLGSKDASKDYIGMAIREGSLISVYNLGGTEKEIVVKAPVTTSDYRESVLDHVKFERIYQHAVLTYVRKSTSSTPIAPEILSEVSNYENTLLDLDPNSVVFYVGGYPPDFNPPPKLKLPFMVGCIELDILNERVISLYNFKSLMNLNTTADQPCKRHRTQIQTYYFEGTGYAHFQLEKENRYEAMLQTTHDKGLLMFLESEGQFFSIELQDGYPVVKYKTETNPVVEQTIDELMNDGQDQKLQVIFQSSGKIVVIFKKKRTTIDSGLKQFSSYSYYLGGLSTELRERYNITAPPFQGFMKDVKIGSKNVPFSDTVGVSRKFLSDLLAVRSATIAKGGQLNLEPNGVTFPADFQTSFGFKTQQSDGILLQHKAKLSELQVVLDKGLVKVKVDREELTSQKPCGDGQMHYVSVRKESSGVKLLVDDEPAASSPASLRTRTTDTTDVELGGGDFDGCITNVFLQRANTNAAVQNLAQYKSRNNVSLGICAIEKPPQSIMLKETEHPNMYKPVKNGRVGIHVNGKNSLSMKGSVELGLESCALIPAVNVVSGAYHFGEVPHSQLKYTFSPELLQKRSHFSIDVKTQSSDGLILFAANEPQGAFLALYLSSGRFVFSFGAGGKRARIRSKDVYTDKQWHTVVFSRDGKNGRLVIDGLRARDGELATDAALDLKSPFVLGAIQSFNGKFKLQDMPRFSFSGCAKNFKVNNHLMAVPSEVMGVVPCYEGTTEPGVYFTGEGGYAVLDNTFVVGENIELVFEIRPRNHTGVLFHVNSQQGSYLSLYMNNGKLAVHVNNGAGDFWTSVTPQQSLCDGQWHKVALIKQKNVVQLDVDTERTYTIGPTSALSTNTKDPLYVGDIPDTIQMPWLPSYSAFAGCLRKVKINEVSAEFSRAVDMRGAVNLNRCPN